MFFYFLFISSLFIHTAHTRYMQPDLQHTNQSTRVKNDLHDIFMRCINFSKQGLRCFIKHVYNAAEYADFLANNFFHVIEFMQRTTDMPRSYLQSVIRMFHNKIKQSMYVNPYALSELLDEMLPYLKKAYQNINAPIYDQLHTAISQTMHDTMLHKFDQLKHSPHTFFNELSHDIITLVGTRHELHSDASIAELRSTLLLFLQTTIAKLVWNTHKPSDAWLNVKLIADQLSRYHQQGIIDDVDDLDDLYTTLLERFYLYLDLAHTELSIETLNTIRTDITSGTIGMFELEQEEHFLSKKDRFNQVAHDIELKIQAYHQGIIVR